MEGIVNKVASSKLVSLNLEEYYPEGERVEYDIAANLYEGLILREKDFRSEVKDHDWTSYQNKYVALHCTTDAIIPTWAFMLIASKLQPFAKDVFFGDIQALNDHLMKLAVEKIDPESYRNAKVVVKGCGDLPISASSYVDITRKLTPVVSSLMFGEPCSTVPIYKQPKDN